MTMPLRILRHALARTIAVLESAEARVSMAIARRERPMREREYEALRHVVREASEVPLEVHERGWQWRPVGDGAFAPPFGTVRACRGCGCLVVGGPTRCARCVEIGSTETAQFSGMGGGNG